MVNIFIKEAIVLPSKGVTSELTNADPSSCEVSAPVREMFALWKTSYSSDESASGGAGVRGGWDGC